jgi:hypothetical protein
MLVTITLLQSELQHSQSIIKDKQPPLWDVLKLAIQPTKACNQVHWFSWNPSD